MAHAGLSAAVRYRNSTGITSRPEKDAQLPTIAELLLQDYDAEMSNTRRTLERIPEDKPDWAPHDKSMKMGRLAIHCATLPMFGYHIIEDDGMDMANSQRLRFDFTFKSRDACLQQLDESSAAEQWMPK
jgi:hypothetical protein